MYRFVLMCMATLLVVTGCSQQVAEPEEPTATQAEPQSVLEGVWQLAEAYGRNAEGDYRWDPIQPGLQIFHDGYYSVVSVRGNEARPLFNEEETAATVSEEKLRTVFGQFGAQAGTYEISGSTLTRAVVVAKNPNLTQGTRTPNPQTFRLDGDVLTIRSDNADGTWQEARWRRLR